MFNQAESQRLALNSSDSFRLSLLVRKHPGQSCSASPSSGSHSSSPSPATIESWVDWEEDQRGAASELQLERAVHIKQQASVAQHGPLEGMGLKS